MSLIVEAVDPQGNVDRLYTGTVHVTSSDGQATLPADYTFSVADQGGHTFTVTLKTAGSQTVTVTDQDTGAVTGTNTVEVTPAAADHFQIDAPATTQAGQAFDLTVTALDPYGNVDVHYQSTITFTSSDGQALLPADSTFTLQDQGVITFSGGASLFLAGSQTITATDLDTGLLVGDATILVTPAAADHFQLTAPPRHRAGRAFDVTATALDPYGNVDVNYAGTITFTSSDDQALLPDDYTFTTPDQGMVTFAAGITLFTLGSQTITVTDLDTGLLSGSATVRVTPGPADSRPLMHSGREIPVPKATETAADPSRPNGMRDEAERDRFFAILADDADIGQAHGWLSVGLTGHRR